jgi:hypothetical protein
MVLPIFQSDLRKEEPGLFQGVLLPDSPYIGGDHYVFQGGKILYKVMELKNKTYPLPPEEGEAAFLKTGNIRLPNLHRPGIGMIQAA